MRENINFRAWSIKFKEYWNVAKIDFRKKEVLVDRPFIDGLIASRTFKFEEVILEQYTGLKDKNGVEIYENDLVLYDRNWFTNDTLDKKTYVVKYDNEYGEYYIENNYHIRNISWESVEIVGNKHEIKATDGTYQHTNKYKEIKELENDSR